MSAKSCQSMGLTIGDVAFPPEDVVVVVVVVGRLDVVVVVGGVPEVSSVHFWGSPPQQS